MVFSKALALKVLGGTLFLGSASTGIYFINDHLQNQLTVYDQALIDHLNVENADIKFAVLGSGGSAVADSDLSSFTTNTEKTITVKVKIGGTSETTEGKITPKAETGEELGTVNYLKNFNKTGSNKAAADWTWTCEIKLTKKTGITDANELNEKQKEKIFKSNDSSNSSFLNKLKANSSDNKEIKKLKQDFIRNCASARGTSINRGINGLENIGTAKEKLKVAENEIKSEKKFELRKGNTSNDAWGAQGTKEEDSKLYFSNKWEFENWFKAKADQQPR